MRRKILIAVVAAPVLLLLVGLLYLRFGDHGWIREPIERKISEALSRDLTIAGKFDFEALPSPRLVAEDVTLANPDWCDEPAMVHVDRIELAVGLLSLWNRRPLVVRDLQIEGVRVSLERDAEDRASWDFGIDRGPKPEVKPEAKPEGPPFQLDSVGLDDFKLTYHDPSREAPLRFAVDRLDAGRHADEMFALDLTGGFERLPVGLTGRITSLAELLEGEPLHYDLHGRVGKIEVTSSGEISDVATLGGPDLTMRLHGPDLEACTDLLGLPSLGSGRFELNGRAKPSSEGVELTLDVDLVDLQAEAHGHADSLADPEKTDLDVKVSGGNLHAAGFLFGLKNLPPGEFEASVALSSDGTHVNLDHLKAHVGENVASVEGVIRTSKEVVDQELKFQVEGPDLSIFSPLVGMELAERSYRLDGHLVRIPEGIGVESIAGRVGNVDIHMSGTVQEVFRFAGAKVDIRTKGPDLSEIRVLSHLPLPAGPFVLDGNVETSDEAFVFDGVEGRAGDTTVSFEGTVNLATDYIGTDLRIRAAGHDPAWIAPLTGLEHLPAEPYDFTGRARFTEAGPALDAIEGTYGDVAFELDGQLKDLLVQVSGPDLSWLAAFGAPEGLPAERFEFDGRLRTLDVGYELEDFKATLGSIALELDGRLGELPDVDGTDVELKVRGPELSALSAYADLPPLPAESFSAAGHLTVESGAYRLKTVSGELGRHHIAADGTLVPSTGLSGTELELAVSGPDLADAGRIAGEFGLEELPKLPEATYSLAGEVRVDDSGYELQHVVARVAQAEANVDGRLGKLPDGFGSDLTVEAKGPDASIIAAIGDVALPADRFTLRGRMERGRSGARFHGVVADLGDYHAEIDGTLGEPPTLDGTNLDLRASGPDLSLISDLADLPALPDGSFEVSAHFDGSPKQFAMQRFTLHLGRSDLAGEFRVDLEGSKPALEGDFTSERFDLDELLAGDEGGQEAQTEGGSKFLLSEEPLNLELLDELDADVHWTIGQAADSRAALGNVVLDAHLLDGGLTLDPVTAEGYGGSFSGKFSLEPVEDGYRLHVVGKAEQVRLSLLKYSGDPSEIAPVDLDVRFLGQGRSLHAIASSADGRLMFEQGSGKIDNSALTKIAASPLSNLYTTLNPFTKSDPYTKLECIVNLIEMRDGVAHLEPLAMRTDKMVMLGKGEVDFETEKVKLHWVTKPRKGVGLSASMITNSFIKLGGTLSKPAIEVSSLKAARETGATVATGGIWLLYKTVFNRVTAERKVCNLALKTVAKKTKKAAKKEGR